MSNNTAHTIGGLANRRAPANIPHVSGPAAKPTSDHQKFAQGLGDALENYLRKVKLF